MKQFHTHTNIGRAKYTISYHDGEKKHADGSDFFDIRIFSNKREFEKAVKRLKKNGFQEK